jgi:putative transposase
MPNYRRVRVPGGAVFLTIVTRGRRPLFARPDAVAKLRLALRQVRAEAPFAIPAAVVLPDHAHFLWVLPPGDWDYSRRVGRMKVRCTRSLRCGVEDVNGTGRRGGDVWQPRFWEHTIVDEVDFERHLDYIHINPVKHGLASCPHGWPHSSFARWVRLGHYPPEWGCCCGDRRPWPPMVELGHDAGE